MEPVGSLLCVPPRQHPLGATGFDRTSLHRGNTQQGFTSGMVDQALARRLVRAPSHGRCWVARRGVIVR